MSKGEITTNEFLKVVLAVAVFVLLGYATVKLYQVVIGDNEIKNVRNIMDQVKAKADAIQPGQNTTMTLVGFDGGESWLIAAWGKNDASAPDKCIYSSCICICSVSDGFNLIDSCQKRSICDKIDAEFIRIENKVIIDDTKPSGLQINSPGAPPASYGEKEITINTISIGQSFSELRFSKTKDAEGNTILKITQNG